MYFLVGTPFSFKEEILIIEYEYYARSSEYLIYNRLDCSQVSHKDLKADDLLVAEYVSKNSSLFNKGARQLKSQAKDIIEVNDLLKYKMCAATRIKSKLEKLENLNIVS